LIAGRGCAILLLRVVGRLWIDMNLLPCCVVYSQDEALLQKIRGYLLDVAAVRGVEDQSKIENTLTHVPQFGGQAP
jgi:hypothetical protein